MSAKARKTGVGTEHCITLTNDKNKADVNCNFDGFQKLILSITVYPSPIPEADSCSDNEEIPHLYRTRSLITVFRGARQKSLSLAK